MEDKQVPRFVLSLTDTQTTIEGANGKEYMNISIASDKLSDFVKHIPVKKRQNAGHNEFQAMLEFFADQVAKTDLTRVADEVVEYSNIEKDKL